MSSFAKQMAFRGSETVTRGQSCLWKHVERILSQENDQNRSQTFMYKVDQNESASKRGEIRKGLNA